MEKKISLSELEARASEGIYSCNKNLFVEDISLFNLNENGFVSKDSRGPIFRYPIPKNPKIPVPPKLKNVANWDLRVFFPNVSKPQPYQIGQMKDGGFVISLIEDRRILKIDPTDPRIFSSWEIKDFPNSALVAGLAVDRFHNDEVYLGGENINNTGIWAYKSDGKFIGKVRILGNPIIAAHSIYMKSKSEMIVGDEIKSLLYIMERSINKSEVVAKVDRVIQLGNYIKPRQMIYNFDTKELYVAMREEKNGLGKGQIIKVDYKTGKIQSWGKNLSLKHPHGIAIDYTNKIVYVADTFNFRILVCDYNGNLLSVQKFPFKKEYPRYMIASNNGKRLYVTNYHGYQINIFTIQV